MELSYFIRQIHATSHGMKYPSFVSCVRRVFPKETNVLLNCVHIMHKFQVKEEKKCISKKGKNVTSRREIEDACLLVCTKNHLLKPDLSTNILPFSKFTSEILNCFVLKRICSKTKQSRCLLVKLVMDNMIVDGSGLKMFAYTCTQIFH